MQRAVKLMREKADEFNFLKNLCPPKDTINRIGNQAMEWGKVL